MNYRLILLIAWILLLTPPMRAQNSIDNMVEEYSTVGGSRFTSAVERDPKTRRVKKVVKQLHVDGVNAKRFISGFKREAKRHRHTVTNTKNGQTTMTLVTDNKQGTRIYMLKYDNPSYMPSASITIVIVPY